MHLAGGQWAPVVHGWVMHIMLQAQHLAHCVPVLLATAADRPVRLVAYSKSSRRYAGNCNTCLGIFSQRMPSA